MLILIGVAGHFLSTIFNAILMINAWPVDALWYIFGAFGVIPFIYDMILVVKTLYK